MGSENHNELSRAKVSSGTERKKGVIAYVSINREKALNADTNCTLFELQKAWLDHEKDDNLFSGEFIAVEEAYRLGLAFKVVPADQVLDETTKAAEKLCESSPGSIRTLKESIERGSLLPLGETFKLSKQIAAKFEATPGYQEAMKAFLEKKDLPHRIKK